MLGEAFSVSACLRAKKRPSRRSKYGNQITYINGERFDSAAEGVYHKRLVLLKAAGKIAEFKRQVAFEVGPGIKYVADFVVWKNDRPSSWYAVDVKGTLTKVFRLKAKLYREKFSTHPLIIAKAVYQKGKLIGFRETEYGKERRGYVDFQ